MANSHNNSLVCSLCKGKAIFFETVHSRDYFKCKNCEGIQLHPNYFLSAEAEKARYDTHNNNVNDKGYQKFVKPIVDAVINNTLPSYIGLDYGCGSGPVITKLLEDKGYALKLYDPYYKTDTSVLQYIYDFIVCCEVMEHFYAPNQEFLKMTQMLKSGGYLFLKTNLYEESIRFKDWWYTKDETHVFFYTQATLNWLAKAFNLDLIEASTTRIILQKR